MRFLKNILFILVVFSYAADTSYATLYRSKDGCAACGKVTQTGRPFSKTKNQKQEELKATFLRELNEGDICHACICAVNRWRKNGTTTAGDFLRGLPSFNKENFTKFNSDGSQAKTLSKRPTVCIQFKEETQTKPQVIITDKTNILLRYLRKQSDVKNIQQKRSLSSSENPSPSRKMPRMATSTTTIEERGENE